MLVLVDSHVQVSRRPFALFKIYIANLLATYSFKLSTQLSSVFVCYWMNYNLSCAQHFSVTICSSYWLAKQGISLRDGSYLSMLVKGKILGFPFVNGPLVNNISTPLVKSLKNV